MTMTRVIAGDDWYAYDHHHHHHCSFWAHSAHPIDNVELLAGGWVCSNIKRASERERERDTFVLVHTLAHTRSSSGVRDRGVLNYLSS